MAKPIVLTIDLDEIEATRDDVTHRTPTTLGFVQIPKSGWLAPVPAHLRALLPGELPPSGAAPQQIALFPATPDGVDRTEHLAATLNALAPISLGTTFAEH